MTPNSKTVFRPFFTRGSKCAITFFTPNRDTPGMLGISSIASSCSLLSNETIFRVVDLSRSKQKTKNKTTGSHQKDWIHQILGFDVNIGFLPFAKSGMENAAVKSFGCCHFQIDLLLEKKNLFLL